GHAHQRAVEGRPQGADRRPGQQRRGRRTARALHAGPQVHRRGQAESVVPVQCRRARQGRRRAAPPGQDDRNHHGAVTAVQSTAILAHGLGGSTDLPVPLAYAIVGAAWALTFTFALVALAWRRPRFDPDKQGRPLPGWVTTTVDAPATRWVVAIA